MNRRWYSGLPSAAIKVDCGDARHTLRWRKGRVIVEDHDVNAELALTALGGDPAPCLQLLAAWRHGVTRCDTVRWLTAEVVPPSSEGLAFLSASMSTGSSATWAVTVGGNWPGGSGPSPAQRRKMMATIEAEMRQRQLHRLLTGLGQDWLHRAATAAAVHALRGTERAVLGKVPEDDVDLTEILSACVIPAVEENIRRWRGPRASRQWFLVECLPFEGAGPAGITGSVDDHVGLAAVTVPLGWLVDVWARNAAIIDDCFVLAARRLNATTLSVDVARWERDASGRSYPIVSTGQARRTGDHWRLA